MKRQLICALLLCASQAFGIESFKGAVGPGGEVVGGRNGNVYVVLNNGNSGDGSLRDALSTGRRTVIIATSGNIVLSSPIQVNNDSITILGMYSPGGIEVT